MSQDYQRFKLGDVELQSGEVLRDAFLAWTSWGTLSSARDNVVLMPTFYTGTHRRNLLYTGPGRALDPAQYFIVSINMFGNGLSCSPSNPGVSEQGGSRFPKITLYDNVKCQQQLLLQALGVEQLALVTGWSMGGCQTYHWAAMYPDRVKAILPFCASAKTSIHNHVFLEGVKAALQADSTFNNGDYTTPPEAGLRAFARVYAGWAFSQAFFRNELFKENGYANVEALLVDWENEHVNDWDANDLLCKLWSWQHADISANELYQGDIVAALGAIQARSLLLPSSTDLYFPPEDNITETKHIPSATMRTFDTDWGHCAASPSNPTGFQEFFDVCVRELMAAD